MPGGSSFIKFNSAIPTGGGGGPATLIFSDEFTSFDLASNSNPNGAWRPDARWQDINQGYRDFAGTSWNINPNDTTTAAFPAFSVANSVLTIKAFRTPAGAVAPIRTELNNQGNAGLPDPAWCGGLILTNSAVRQFRYGYFEFRAQWPNPGRGMFPALWFYSSLLGNDPQAKGRSEIDLVEIYGNPGGSNVVTTLIRGMTDGTNVGVSQHGPANGDTSGWHTYGMDWQPTYINVYVDNVLLYSIGGVEATWFSAPMDIYMNFAMDAPWFAANLSDGTTPSPMSMNIDYIRVYDIKP